MLGRSSDALASASYGQRAIAFIDEVDRATNHLHIETLFAKYISEFGFHAYIMAGIPNSNGSLEKFTLANGWPAEWSDIYTRENLWTADPIPRHALRTVDPFAWSEAPYDRENDIAARNVMERSQDFRFNTGFCIPIHYSLSTAAVSMAGDRPHLTDDTRRALHIAGLYAHMRISSLVRPLRPKNSLSIPERDVLQWAAVGKTIWETSVIMRISEHRVKYYLAEAQRKLNADNRTAAVVQALIKGEIKI